MRPKPIIRRQTATRDVHAILDHHVTEGGDQTALDFIEALERAYTHIGRHPATGSTRYAHELSLPELRFWPLARHPHFVFYVERSDHIDVWRVLHGQRDIPAWIREPEDG